MIGHAKRNVIIGLVGLIALGMSAAPAQAGSRGERHHSSGPGFYVTVSGNPFVEFGISSGPFSSRSRFGSSGFHGSYGLFPPPRIDPPFYIRHDSHRRYFDSCRGHGRHGRPFRNHRHGGRRGHRGGR